MEQSYNRTYHTMSPGGGEKAALSWRLPCYYSRQLSMPKTPSQCKILQFLGMRPGAYVHVRKRERGVVVELEMLYEDRASRRHPKAERMWRHPKHDKGPLNFQGAGQATPSRQRAKLDGQEWTLSLLSLTSATTSSTAAWACSDFFTCLPPPHNTKEFGRRDPQQNRQIAFPVSNGVQSPALACLRSPHAKRAVVVNEHDRLSHFGPERVPGKRLSFCRCRRKLHCVSPNNTILFLFNIFATPTRFTVTLSFVPRPQGTVLQPAWRSTRPRSLRPEARDLLRRIQPLLPRRTPVSTTGVPASDYQRWSPWIPGYSAVGSAFWILPAASSS